jgi:regulator of protease activity HflC (stomatin/prohibitin superfamily)
LLSRLHQVAEGQAAAKRALADADLYAQQKEAEAMLAKANAQAEGLRQFFAIGDPDLIKFYLGLERNLYTNIAGEPSRSCQHSRACIQ